MPALIIKVIILFLIFISVMAMFGKYKFPGQQKLQSMKCRKCGRYRIGEGPCSCNKA